MGNHVGAAGENLDRSRGGQDPSGWNHGAGHDGTHEVNLVMRCLHFRLESAASGICFDGVHHENPGAEAVEIVGAGFGMLRHHHSREDSGLCM